MTRLDYAGDIDPEQTWDILKNKKDSVLIDCRSSAEWQFVGIPDLETIDKKPFLIEWQSYPAMNLNQNFLDEIQQSNLLKDQTIVLMCRSGGRSRSAAEYLTSQGYENCYNCLYGFEGNHNSDGHRGLENGWKFSKLPWKQG